MALYLFIVVGGCCLLLASPSLVSQAHEEVGALELSPSWRDVALEDAIRDNKRLGKQTSARHEKSSIRGLEHFKLPSALQKNRASVAAIALYSSHDASIAISKNGRVQCVMELERLFEVRYFNPGMLPDDNVDPHDKWIDDWKYALRIVRDSCPYEDGVAPHSFEHGILVFFGDDDPRKFKQLPGIVEDVVSETNSWHIVNHHDAHALFGFYDSPFRSALVVTYDGGGNDGVFNVYAGLGYKLYKVAALDFNLGSTYNFLAPLMPEVTGSVEPLPELCAFHDRECNSPVYNASFWNWTAFRRSMYVRMGDAGKIMGYAGTGGHANDLALSVRLAMWKHSGRSTWTDEIPCDILSHACYSLESQRNVGFAIQNEFEKLVYSIIEDISKITDASDNFDGLVLSGGCALNVLVNQMFYDVLQESPSKISDDSQISSPETESRLRLNVHIPPSPNDGGLTVGALWAISPPLRHIPLQYVGFPVFDADILPALIRERGPQYLPDVGGVEYLAELLAGGPAWLQNPLGTSEKPIIGVVRGRQEFGPRALGHRSLLAVPDSKEMQDRMNKLKFRQWYRPVAPMLADEALEEVFGRRVKSPYMTMAPRVVDDIQTRFPAIVHMDGTARHQSVGEEDEPWLHKLLLAVGRRTGLSALINTSFNSQGKPIVNRIAEAIHMLDELDDLDYVLVEDWLFSVDPKRSAEQ